MAPKQEWLVIIKDKPDSLEARMKVRPQHLADLRPNVDRGFWTFGGGTLSRPPAETDGRLEIDGSAMLAAAESREEVLAVLEGDVYAVTGVWDLETVQIIPFKTAIREPL